jgi:membrane protease YdiL (CAAX protease family)
MSGRAEAPVRVGGAGVAAAQPLLLLAGLAAAVALRVAVAGRAGSGSVPAGVAFGAAMLVLAVAGGWRPAVPSRRALLLRGAAAGVMGAAVLLAPPVAVHLGAAPLRLGSPGSGFAVWAAVVTLVAVAEEVLLRGALISALLGHVRPEAAVGIAAVAFALLHVPVYGWVAVPLDVAVGGWLGGLRLATGGVTAPATAHALADLATWWLR